jgi:hypothetical protein
MDISSNRVAVLVFFHFHCDLRFSFLLLVSGVVRPLPGGSRGGYQAGRCWFPSYLNLVLTPIIQKYVEKR